MAARTEDGLFLRILTLIDEYTKKCLVLKATRRLRSQDVLEQLGYLFIYRCLPEFMRSDNGPEFQRKLSTVGWNDLQFKTCLSNREALGRMAIMSRSMGS